jgi:hypothetical protein
MASRTRNLAKVVPYRHKPLNNKLAKNKQTLAAFACSVSGNPFYTTTNGCNTYKQPCLYPIQRS